MATTEQEQEIKADLNLKINQAVLGVKAKEQAVVAKALAMPLPRGKKKIQASVMGSGDDWFKLLVQGHTGTGKTLFLSGIAQCVGPDGHPLRIFVASTDIGGNGLRSVKEQLASVGREDLIANVHYVEFSDYETFAAFTTNPDDVVDGFWAWDPDVICLDGLANLQESHIWRYILSLDPLAKDAAETRTEGVQAGMAEWGQIRRCTILQIDQFLMLHNPNGKKVHKLVTVLLDDGKESKLTHEIKKGPLILGAARDYIGPAFDAIITAIASSKPGSKDVQYSYRCDITGNSVAKIRGLKLPEAILAKADSKALWETLTRSDITTSSIQIQK